MSGFENRRAAYKLPPGAAIDRSQTQAARRAKALEEQKRRRAQRIESERHIDLFADLSLGNSEDEDREGDEHQVLREGVGHLASLVQSSSTSTSALPGPAPEQPPRKVHRKKRGGKRTNPWADQCMYAELLEMSADESRMSIDGTCADDEGDALPPDLETAWVAVAPVPSGKRCLVVCLQGSGPAGVVPNTTLRSRVVGKPLMPRFPSPLPSDTILDCILDEHWQETGILHVLDVLKWKGQDVADCETTFRFWWRDTRLSELPPPRPAPSTTNEGGHHFAYPSTFLPVSYHTSTSYSSLLTHVIPRARAPYTTIVTLPPPENGAMDTGEPVRSQATLRSDGLLLYVAAAIYEPGTSPLSLWVPNAAWYPLAQQAEVMDEDTPTSMDVFERYHISAIYAD
ncbi:hypothetical protein K488DRAFT_50990 [Vararia minispora EC-137]|uniref:Uncharacterized protein n=1 Tax=Vararia minispora EC-137 TaxID=1314806 RepID=A0ACB8QJW5_9AGAM|nr:hypothetical protein K488DRAFT_50990 [Vararia minispora EC-137]